MFLKFAYNTALKEGEGKMSQKKTPKKILLICIMLCLAVIGMNYLWSCTFGTDRLPTGKNSGDDKVNGIVQKSHSLVKEKENTKDEMRLLSNEYRSQDSDIMADIKNLEQPAELTSQNEKILVKSQFVVSYNMEKLCPNYVCWSLTPERLNGKVQRSDKFHADFSIDEFQRVDYFDFNGSGYDRGHMCPAGDNKNSEEAMLESFAMTNICPQNHSLNMDLWNDLEKQCRSWVRKYGTLYICCGPIFDKKTSKTIGRRKKVKIAVPDRFFKVILTLEDTPKAVGFIYPNRSCDGKFQDYAMSVDEVEKQVNMDFFYQLDEELEQRVEKVFDLSAWGI